MFKLTLVSAELTLTLTSCLALMCCSSGEALTPKQEQSYGQLLMKHDAVLQERAELHQKLERQFRAHSKAERSTKQLVKGVAACGVAGRSAKLNLKTFKKRPSALSFTSGGSGKRGCEGLKVKVKR